MLSYWSMNQYNDVWKGVVETGCRPRFTHLHCYKEKHGFIKVGGVGFFIVYGPEFEWCPKTTPFNNRTLLPFEYRRS